MKRSFWTILVVFTAQISWAAITIDVATSTDRSSAASSIKSSSFSTHGSNELLLAFIATDASSSGMTVTGVSGGGLTWALAARANAQLGTAEIWRGFATNQLTSITVTANLSQSVAASMTVVAFIGTDPSGSNGSGAIGAINFHSANPGAASCSLVTTRNGSWVFGVGNDWDRAVARTLGPNQSMVHQYLSTVGDTYWVQSLNSPTPLSGTTVTVNDTAPTNDRYNLAIAEILSAQGTSNGFSISGTISPSNSANGSTVTLSQNSTTITTTTADASDSYSFSNLQNGSYTLTPSKNGFNFSPASQTAVINGANVSGINFTATAQTWTISGNISPATSGIPVTLSGTSSANTTTDSSGNYSFNGLGSGSYTVTPSQSGEVFSPASLQVTVNSANSNGNNFTWTSGPDLTISKTHSGNFAQGQTGATYAITATNVGGGPTSGTVTVTDTLPTGLTAVAMSGTNWNCTLATLTCTRSDSLAAGTSYPAITLTVNVDSNAPASLTNTATVSGGGESNTANDSASDVTTVTGTTGNALMHVGGASGHPVVNNQTMTFNYTPVGINDAVVVLIGCRSPGVTGLSLTAPGWTFFPISRLVGPSGYYDFISTFGAITPSTAQAIFTVTLTGGNGNCTNNDTTVLVDEFAGNDVTGGTTTFDAHNESLDSAVNGICTGASVTPANNNDAIWYACFDNVTDVNGGYTKGQDDATGDWTEYKILSGGLGVVQNPGFITNPNYFSFGLGGVAIKARATIPDLTIVKTHSGNFVQGQTGATYTITATNVGGAPTSGTVTVTDTLPTGLTAAAMSGTNWNCTLATLTCTRSDSLAAGTSYPAITLTVNVDSNAPASLTNTATVSGGGESNTANDQASDVTSIATTNPTGIKLIQSNVNGNESGTSSMSVSFALSNTQGNFLIVTGSAARPASAISVSDTLGNTYAPALGPVTDTTQNVTVYIWYVANCRGGANTVTITPSGTAALEIHVSEWSGLATASPIDQTAYATGTSSVVSSGAATTTANGELIFGYGWVLNTATAGSGFTPISLVNGDLDEYQIQATAGSVAASFTQMSGTWLALMCTFKPASGGTQSWTISGNISPPTSGIPVSLTGASSASTTTDASGNYAFTGLANGTYTVTPSQSGQVFTPASLQVTLNGANSTGNNFTWSAGTTYTISGSVTPALAGANMSLSGPTTASTLTDVSGNYSFSGLANGVYTLTPSKSGYTFSPSTQSVMVNNANATANFGDQGSVATLAIDAVVFADVQTAATTVTSPVFSTRAGNELVLAFVSADYGTGVNTTVTGITGGGLNWVLVKRANARSGTAEIWRAFAGSPLSNATVTATLSQRVVSSVTVVSFTGADASGTNGSGAIGATNAVSLASGAPSASMTTTRPGSWVFGVGDDYDKPVARTLGANQTMIHEDPSSTGDDYWVQRQNATTPNSGTSVTINDIAPTGDQFNLAIVEVLAGVTADTTPPTVSLISPAPNATVATLQTITASANDNVGVASVQLQLDGSNLGALLTSAPFELVWDSSGAAAGTHTLSAIARDGAGNSASSPIVPINVDHSGNTAVVGSWSAPVTLPAVAVNLVLMKNNKLLVYQDGSTPDMWDYINNTFSNVPTAANLFCSGHAELADGRLLVVGGFGGSSSALGISNAEIFDSATNSWTPVPSMSYARWYPTATTLSDGRILVTGGWETTEHTNVGIPEIYDPSSNTWTKLSNANNPFETYPFIYLLPDGRLVHVGGSEYATVTETLDLNAQTWTTVDANIVDGSSSKMYLPYKIMKAGTAADSQMTGSAANTAYVIDMSQANPKWQQIPSMAYPRSFMNLTELPDGTVLATGGETDKNGGNIANAVYAAELWDPQTQTWTTMSSMQKPREYHGTALLLPDGRVAVSGMGADFGNVPDQLSAEFFSPPYLFKGPRPTISQAPAQMQYGQSYSIQTSDAASISKVVLIRTGSVTHFFDQNTRYVPVSFSQIQGGLNVAPPANGNAAPPGYYMLFLVNSAGVPSVANFVQVTP